MVGTGESVESRGRVCATEWDATAAATSWGADFAGVLEDWVGERLATVASDAAICACGARCWLVAVSAATAVVVVGFAACWTVRVGLGKRF
jgi:hypothetical protein